MFIIGAETELLAIFILVGFAFVISSVVAFFVKEKKKAVLLFSVLANVILFTFILYGTRIFYVYDILWLRTFAVFAWPIINIFFINKIFFSKK
ncbi:MAG: hypothetical protein WCF93_01840 [Candidatus Moraniibacteriota bacterium]